GGAAALGGALEAHAQRPGPAAEGRGDARGEPVARGAADDQRLLRAALDGAALLHMADLLLHRSAASDRMGGGAKESTDFGLDDHAFPSRMPSGPRGRTRGSPGAPPAERKRAGAGAKPPQKLALRPPEGQGG